ncbi:uncharacterized protein [Linepithema humile]|uniref:uncharacterized protein n=1 Tax=Linepithema humile TaxID=83485 RepID=UPI00351EC01C
MSTRLLQANLNHARQAQDLFLEDLCGRDAGLDVVAEPYSVPDSNPNWVAAADGSAVIIRRHSPRSPSISLMERGREFVIARWGALRVVGVYAPPSMSYPEFLQLLREMGAGIRRCLPHPVLVAGDFNAWNMAWGSRRTGKRGENVMDWAAELDLQLLNWGSKSTCVHPRGESIVDLTWASPRAARLVESWGVTDRESLSDYQIIEMVLTATPREVLLRRLQRGNRPPRRWILAKLDQDKLEAAVLVEM